MLLEFSSSAKYISHLYLYYVIRLACQIHSKSKLILNNQEKILKKVMCGKKITKLNERLVIEKTFRIFTFTRNMAKRTLYALLHVKKLIQDYYVD
jgi:hypothetical protein